LLTVYFCLFKLIFGHTNIPCILMQGSRLNTGYAAAISRGSRRIRLYIHQKGCFVRNSKEATFRVTGGNMKESRLTIPELILIAGTRVALGVGVGLLLSGRLSSEQRRAVGLTLTLVGCITTIPLVMNVVGKSKAADDEGSIAA
jgi:hypothetical protein